MPRDKTIQKVLVIGSGPIVIGQAAEFDYAGTQACRVLRKEGVEIVLVNSNPATIMTDKSVADKIYLEPLTLITLKRIIEKEHPDSILSGLGGQTGLTLCMQLAREGFLEKRGIRLLGSSLEAIDKAEDRQCFKDTMQAIGQPVIPSVVVTEAKSACDFAQKIGYPVIVRPAFTLGGSGGGIAESEEQLIKTVERGLNVSPISQVLVERSVAGWKEIEFEVMRDSAGNAVAVCSMENFDPVGIHTGDSIVVAPTLTLADKEYQMLRTAALAIIGALGVEGGCNCQFALDPDSFEYAVIEVNPRVSRSSALASKATGYPIAKVATHIALGYTLDEIMNEVTGTTYAAFEPALDYVAVKVPKWPFDKFVTANRELGTQMKATGEVMAIDTTFEDALLKAVRGTESGQQDLTSSFLQKKTDVELNALLDPATDERLFVLYELLCRGASVEELHQRTKIDRWFLHSLARLTQGVKPQRPLLYKMVDTCAGEFEVHTPYFYSTCHGVENEARFFIEKSKRPRIIVLGSGPIRIGQGIEFDYACVQCVWALKKSGYEVIVINNNPETVSTDFDTADRLYFEPLCFDDVMRIIELENPLGVMVAFGGGTAIKLAKNLADQGVCILGTPAESIDVCEDRKRFDKLLETLHIRRPQGFGVNSKKEAFDAIQKLGYPVLLRPSYVLGGQNMSIAHCPEDVSDYMDLIFRTPQENPVLIDAYLQGKEIEVDALCDGEDVLIPGIMEHVERAGVHSGDSIAVYPPVHISEGQTCEIFNMTYKLCKALHIKGIANFQYILHEENLYVIEVNPRVSRTVPYMGKVTGIPLGELAARLSMGEKLSSLGYTSGIVKVGRHHAVKVPVFSFEKLLGVDTHLGPEMKSTGEVLGIGDSLEEALYKGLVSAGYTMRKQGGILITVRDSDKPEIEEVAKKFDQRGFSLYATQGTAHFLVECGLEVHEVKYIHESPNDNTETLLESGKVSYVVSTSKKGRDPALDEVRLRRKACSLSIPCLTSVDTAHALAVSLLSGYNEENTKLVESSHLNSEHCYEVMCYE